MKFGRTWSRRPKGSGNEIIVEGDTAKIALVSIRGEVVGHAVVDAADLERVRPHRWYLATVRGKHRHKRHRYVCRGSDDLSLHRFLMDAPFGMEVDHIDNDGLNNRRSNLRVVTRAQNAQNFARAGREDMRGITRKRKRWATYVSVGGRIIHGPVCATIEEARKAVAELRAIHMPFANEERHHG